MKSKNRKKAQEAKRAATAAQMGRPGGRSKYAAKARRDAADRKAAKKVHDDTARRLTRGEFA